MERSARGSRRWKRSLVVAAVGVLLVGVVAYVVMSLAIASGVRAAEEVAMREHPGDQISALMAYVDSPAQALSDRNRAIWALGQLGDPRALPILERYVTGGKCRHGQELCQYELAKAIRLCRGGTNVTALVWRHRSL